MAGSLAISIRHAGAGTPTGSIRGTIYHDLNHNGIRDAGEAGLRRGVILAYQGTQIAGLASDEDGAYRFDSLADGVYTLEARVNTSAGECSDYDFTFNPYANRSYCIDYKVPWNAIPGGNVEVAVHGGGDVVQDFGAHEADVMIVAGIALSEDARAPEGTLIEVLSNGVGCGSATARGPDSELNYLVHVDGAGQREGCPARGDTVRFRIGGVDAAEVRLYRGWAENPNQRLQLQPLTAIRQHAWLWAERRVTEAPPSGTMIDAIVGGVSCGSVRVEYANRVVGFSRFLVASDELIDGCGTEGAQMSFRTGDLDGVGTLSWSAHLREVSMRFYGDVNCNYGASSVDALLVLQVVSGRQSGLPCPEGSDVNGSGRTDAIDAALVLQKSADIIERLPVS